MAKHIFILGYMHSGTSLVQNLIGNHSAIFDVGHEIHFFRNLHTCQSLFNNDLEVAEIKKSLKQLILCGFTKWYNSLSKDVVNRSIRISPEKLIKLYLEAFSELSEENNCKYFIYPFRSSLGKSEP